MNNANLILKNLRGINVMGIDFGIRGHGHVRILVYNRTTCCHNRVVDINSFLSLPNSGCDNSRDTKVAQYG